MSKSPTQRTLEMLREVGYPVVEKTEHWNQFSRRRNDLFGFIDVLAMDQYGIRAFQATSTGNMGARVKKILASEAAWVWIQNSCRGIVVIGWKKYAKAKNRKYWRATLKEIQHSDFVEARGKRTDGD